MAVTPLDPQIANRVKARKRSRGTGMPNLEGITPKPSAPYVLDAGERDAPKIDTPKIDTPFTGRGQNAYENFGSLEGLTGQFGPATHGTWSHRLAPKPDPYRIRELDEARLARDFDARNFGVGGVANTKSKLWEDNDRKNMLRDHFGLQGQMGDQELLGGVPGWVAGSTTAAAAPTGPAGLGGGHGGPDGGANNSALDTIEEDLMSGGAQFGDLSTLQAALVKMRGSMNATELQRSRTLEDFALALDKYRRQADRLRRGIPGSFNQKGMLNSGQFDRGMGEFEGQVIRDETNQRHKLQRVLQDLNFADRSSGYTFDETIRENAIQGALDSAAKAANVTVPGLEGGYNPVGRNVLNESGQNWMDALIQSIVKRT